MVVTKQETAEQFIPKLQEVDGYSHGTMNVSHVAPKS